VGLRGAVATRLPSLLFLQHSLVLRVRWGPPLFLQCWQNFAGSAFFGTRSPGFPEAECFLELPLVVAEAADASFAFTLRLAWCFLSMMCLIASRSSRRALGDLGSVECVMLTGLSKQPVLSSVQFQLDQPHQTAHCISSCPQQP
jgi:hypothetical protein